MSNLRPSRVEMFVFDEDGYPTLYAWEKPHIDYTEGTTYRFDGSPIPGTHTWTVMVSGPARLVTMDDVKEKELAEAVEGEVLDAEIVEEITSGAAE